MAKNYIDNLSEEVKKGHRDYFNLYPLKGATFAIRCPPDLEFILEAVHPKVGRVEPVSDTTVGGQRRQQPRPGMQAVQRPPPTLSDPVGVDPST